MWWHGSHWWQTYLEKVVIFCHYFFFTEKVPNNDKWKHWENIPIFFSTRWYKLHHIIWSIWPHVLEMRCISQRLHKHFPWTWYFQYNSAIFSIIFLLIPLSAADFYDACIPYFYDKLKCWSFAFDYMEAIKSCFEPPAEVILPRTRSNCLNHIIKLLSNISHMISTTAIALFACASHRTPRRMWIQGCGLAEEQTHKNESLPKCNSH